MLSLEKYTQDFPEEVGQTAHIHHCRAGKGNDALYLTRNTDGSVVGYCHHCHEHGVWRNRSFKKATRGENTTTKTAKNPYKLPPLAEWDACSRWEQPEFSALPKEFRQWWFKSGLDVVDLEYFDVKFLDGKRPAIPLRKGPELVGLAMRSFDASQPKWVNFGSMAVSPIIHPIQTKYHIPKTLVIVEDIISALRCSKHCHALPLMGTRMSDEHFETALAFDGRVVIWLDNDSREVIKTARNYSSRLTSLKSCDLITENIEPKHIIHSMDLHRYLTNG